MANAQQSADPAIIERRLRPVFESLEAGNHKKALSETEKVLKKNPTLQCARALKALSLLRLARDEESQNIIDQLFNERPCVEATLQVMTFWYKEKEQFDKICAIYANAVQQLPGNEELLSHLFMAYVRVNDFQLQQTIALQLYKLTTKTRYYLWAIFSIILKVKCGPDRNAQDKTTVLLALARKMMDKLLADDKLTNDQDIGMYVTVLEMQSKYNDIIQFLDSEIGVRLYPAAPISLKLMCLRKMEKWAELNMLLKQLIYDNRDRWDYYVEYIKTVFDLQKRGGGGNQTTYPSGVDYTFSMCDIFLYELISDGLKLVRGPYLARLELHRVMTNNGFESDAIQLHGQIYDLIIEYYRLFGHKPFCTKDLSVFIKCISINCRSFLSSHFDGICSVRNTTLPKNIDDMQRHICAEQILRMTDESAFKLIQKVGYKHVDNLITMYKYGVKEFTITAQDFGPSDPYAILAAHIIYNLSTTSTDETTTSSTKILSNGLCLLKYLLKNSPSNFHAKLLCLQIQQILGYGWAANKTYLSLDIKHVQLDSLGYIHAEQLPMFGIPSIAKPLYDYTLKFFAHSHRETTDFLLLGYKFGSFTKLYEFMDFRDRLTNSLHYATIAAEALLLEIACFKGTYQQNFMAFKQMSINPAVGRPTGDFDSNLSDNRDLDLFQHWNPIEGGGSGGSVDECTNNANGTECLENHQWFKSSNERNVLLIRSTLLRLIAACIELVNPPTTPTTSSQPSPSPSPSPSSPSQLPPPPPPSNYSTLFNLTNEFSKMFLVIRQRLQRTTNIFNNETDELSSLSYHYNVHKNVCDLLPTRLFSYITIDEYEHVFLNIARLILGLFRCTNNKNYTNSNNNNNNNSNNNNNNNTSNDNENNNNNNKNNKRNKTKQKSMATMATNIINGNVITNKEDVTNENIDSCCNIMMNMDDHDECPETLVSMIIENITIISHLVTHSIKKFNQYHFRMWERRQTQECVINCIEALALITFVVTACNEKYGNNAPAKKGKRKQQQQQQQNIVKIDHTVNNICNDHNNECMDRPPISSKTFTIKQCQNLIEMITTELHSNLEICDKALDMWLVNEPQYTADDVEKLDADVYRELVDSVKESHSLMIKELKTIVRDKIRQLS